MSTSDPAEPIASTEGCPWDELAADGGGLGVHDFITTLFSHTANALRRRITVPYADRHGLSVSEWRVLSVLAVSGSLSFADLVDQAAADKAQVSRTLKLLGERGWVRVETLGSHRRGGVVCHMTPAGQALYETVLPEARRSQAAMILTLSPDERRMLYHILKRLRQRCEPNGRDAAPDSGDRTGGRRPRRSPDRPPAPKDSPAR
jgi:DNA-binding MarR family transcriptional regulator